MPSTGTRSSPEGLALRINNFTHHANVAQPDQRGSMIPHGRHTGEPHQPLRLLEEMSTPTAHDTARSKASSARCFLIFLRSRSDSPPQIPNFSPLVTAYSRQSSRT